MTRQSVAAVIPNKDSERTLAATLTSLAFCDEVVLVDDGSTDRSLDIAMSFANVRVLHRRSYIYDNFNFGMDAARADWIIRVDSDEVSAPELQRSILQVLEDRSPAHVMYDARMHLYMLGARVRWGWGKDTFRKTLFRKGVARYACRTEHEDLTYAGPVGRLAGHYDHHTNPTIEGWVAKLNYYTSRDAERNPGPRPLPPLKLMYRTARFFQRLYLPPGNLYRDGYRGLAVAGLCAFAMFIENCKVWERFREEVGESGMGS